MSFSSLGLKYDPGEDLRGFNVLTLPLSLSSPISTCDSHALVLSLLLIGMILEMLSHDSVLSDDNHSSWGLIN